MNTKILYTKTDATFICGIAIILMFIHHIFGFQEWRLATSKLIPIAEYNGCSLELLFARFSKICVSMFAFNTGYSMCVCREIYTSWQKLLKRIVRFLICYWSVYFLYIIYALISNDTLPTIRQCVFNLIGLKCSPNRFWVNVPFAWYVSFYLFVILLFPFIDKVFYKKRKLFYDIILTIICMYFLCSIHEKFSEHPFFYNMLFFGSVLSGYISCKHNFLSYFSQKSINNILILCGILIIHIMLYKYCALEFLYDMILCVPLIGNIIPLIKYLGKIKTVVVFLGNISMNLWFLHGIFFAGTMKWQWILYYPRYSILVLLWAFIMLIPIAVLLKQIQNKLWY